ncbi:uncharacterized protein LOC144411864 [Styela clava]
MEILEELSRQETNLADNLRSVCTPFGDEAEMKLKESSEILFKMGALYLKKSEITFGMNQKTNFLKCAALLHGARVRYEMFLKDCVKVEEIEKLLLNMETSILKYCHAEVISESLYEESKLISQQLKVLREAEKATLAHVKMVPEHISAASRLELQENRKRIIIQLLKENSKSFMEIMQYISAKCILILGDAPCSFALVGLGSLAREEVTLYSDFEHVIVLEDGVENWATYETSVKEYFRWFAVLFQVIIIGLGETFIRSIGIKSLNDLHSDDKSKNWFMDMFTPSGISFDGQVPHSCNNPLGRQEQTKNRKHIVELIQPTHIMANYLTSKENIKNGYYLKDLLARTCFVYGDTEVYSNFRHHCKNILDKETPEDLFEYVSTLMKDNVNPGVLGSYNAFEKIFNVKSLLYRPLTALLSWCAKIHGYSSGSTVQYLTKYKHKFGEKTHQAVYNAFITSCELRARIYAQKGHQRHKIPTIDVSKYITNRGLSESLHANLMLINFFVLFSNSDTSSSFVKDMNEKRKDGVYNPVFVNKNMQGLLEDKFICGKRDSVDRLNLVRVYLEKALSCETDFEENCEKAERLVNEVLFAENYDSKNNLFFMYYLRLCSLRERWNDILFSTKSWFESPYEKRAKESHYNEEMIAFLLEAVINKMTPSEASDYVQKMLLGTKCYFGKIVVHFLTACTMAGDGNSKEAQKALCDVVEKCKDAAISMEIPQRIVMILHRIFNIQCRRLFVTDASITMQLLIRFFETSMIEFENQPSVLVQFYLQLSVIQEQFDEKINYILCAIKLCQNPMYLSECQEGYSNSIGLLFATIPNVKLLCKYKEFVLNAPTKILKKSFLKKTITYSLYSLLWSYVPLFLSGCYITIYRELTEIFTCFLDYLTNPCFSRWVYHVSFMIIKHTKIQEALVRPEEFMNKHYTFLLSERKSRLNPSDPAVEVSAAHRRVVSNTRNSSEIESDIKSIWKVLHNSHATRITKHKASEFLLHLVLTKQYLLILNSLAPRHTLFLAKNSLLPNCEIGKKFNSALEAFGAHNFQHSAHEFWKIIINTKSSHHIHRRAIQMFFSVLHTVYCKNITHDSKILDQEAKGFVSQFVAPSNDYLWLVSGRNKQAS